MDKDFFMNAGIPPQHQYEHPFSNSMNAWQSLKMHTNQSTDCFLSTSPPNDHFDSALSSMVSSPAAANSGLSSENFRIRELIGKLGNTCNSNDLPHINIPPPYIGGGNCSTSNSRYSTPLNSSPKMGMSMSMIDHLVNDKFANLGNSVGLSSTLPAMPGDPGFAERAARFSSFGSRSFNGRSNSSSQFASDKNVEVGFNKTCSNLGDGNGKLQRVSSSPSLKAADESEAGQISNKSSMNERNQSCCGNNSQGNSSISGQNHAAENGSSRKRKAAVPKGKGKDSDSHPQMPSISSKVNENGEDSSAKRSKSDEGNGNERSDTKSDLSKGGDDHKMHHQKPPEPPRDYIHVRARRGQATDSHSLAERVRREKIGERMKLLQDLVPGCNKVTGKALMLDEIINYVQSLQRQVEFLSMKLASVNPRLELNMGNLYSKDAMQQNCSLPHPMYPSDSLAPNLYGQQSHQNPLQESITTAGSTAPSSLDPLNPTLHQNHNLHLPSLDGFPNCLPQLASLCEGDLQSIVQMGFDAQSFLGPNPTPMKIEF